jgi:hypothetical protein
MGGMIPSPEEILEQVESIAEKLHVVQASGEKKWNR